MKRNIGYREYKEKVEKMLNSKIDIGSMRDSASAALRAGAAAGFKVSEFESDFKKKREQKE